MKVTSVFALLALCCAVDANVNMAAKNVAYNDKVLAAISFAEPSAEISALTQPEIDATINHIVKSVKLMANKKVTANIATAVASQVQNLLGLLPGWLFSFVKSLLQALMSFGDQSVANTYLQLKSALNGTFQFGAVQKQQLETAAKVCELFANAASIDLNAVGMPEELFAKSASSYPYASYGYNTGCGSCPPPRPCCPAPLPCCPPPKPCCPAPKPCCPAPKPCCPQTQAPIAIGCGRGPFSQVPGAQFLSVIAGQIPNFMGKFLNLALISATVIDLVITVASLAALYANYNCQSDCCGGFAQAAEVGPDGELDIAFLASVITSLLSAIGSTAISVVFGTLFFVFGIKTIILFLAWILFAPCSVEEFLDFLLNLLGLIIPPSGSRKAIDLVSLLREKASSNSGFAKTALELVDSKLSKFLNVPLEQVNGENPANIAQALTATVEKAVKLDGTTSNVSKIANTVVMYMAGLMPGEFYSAGNFFGGLANALESRASACDSYAKSAMACCDEEAAVDPLIVAALNRLQVLAAGEEEIQNLDVPASTAEYYSQALKNLKAGGNMFIAMENERLDQEPDAEFATKQRILKALAC